MAADPRLATERVVEVLTQAQGLGFLGPGPVEAHLGHSLGFAHAIAAVRRRQLGEQDRVADLGPGGGVPGLVLAAAFPGSRFTLVEGSTRRAEFLAAAVRALGWGSRVSVLPLRAEVAGRDRRWRNRHSVVVARSFGPPSVTAECGAPLLELGGVLVVSEPPGGGGERWLPERLRTLGLGRPIATGGFVTLIQEVLCPERYPRRVGVPRKRPLF